MRLFIATTLLLHFVSAFCLGQNEVTLPQSVNSKDEIIPDQWVLIASTTGDLNQDGISDVALVVQSTDTANIDILPSYGDRVDSTNYNPRVLAIYLGKEAGGYEKKLVNEDFLLRHESNMDEPLHDFTIYNGGLSISLHVWYSMGSWTTSNHNYQFSLEGNHLILNHYGSNELDRGSGSISNYSIDFKTKEIEIREGNIAQDEDQDVVTSKRFQIDKPITLDSMGPATNTHFQGICWL